jgi:nucleoside-diphosphate-sugar epimerase
VREFTLRNYTFRCFDRVTTPGAADCVVGDITDPEACRHALAGASALIHLAATPDDVEDPVKDLFTPNIVGVYRVFEAAKAAGVQRMILASSGQVVWGQRTKGPFPITAAVQPSPRGWYAATKLFLEGAGRAFADSYGLTVVAVRLGWCPRPGQEGEIALHQWAQDVYLSRRDAGQFFACAATAPLSRGFFVCYAASNPVRTCPFDMRPARELLGYEPLDRWSAPKD